MRGLTSNVLRLKLVQGDVSLANGAVMTDVAMPTEGKIVRMHSTLDTNGGKVWDERVHGSPFSAAEVHKVHQVSLKMSWHWRALRLRDHVTVRLNTISTSTTSHYCHACC